jgi:hypothetical protein
LATVTRSLGATLRGETTINLAGSHAFAAHGFAGTVSSTVRIDLGKPGRPRRQNQNGHIPGKLQRLRVVDINYTALVRGGLEANISGDSIPGVCGPLGSCGARGTISVAAGSPHAHADVYAIGAAGRPIRDFLTAVGISRAGRSKGILVLASAFWHSAGLQTSDIRQGSVTCRDRVPGVGGIVQIAGLGAQSAPFFFPYSANSDLFRTRCPGPIGPQAQLPGAFESGKTLRSRISVIAFTRAQPFSDDGYTGTIAPHLTITLRRGKVTSHFEKLPKGLPFSADLARLRATQS